MKNNYHDGLGDESCVKKEIKTFEQLQQQSERWATVNAVFDVGNNATQIMLLQKHLGQLADSINRSGNNNSNEKTQLAIGAIINTLNILGVQLDTNILECFCLELKRIHGKKTHFENNLLIIEGEK